MSRNILIDADGCPVVNQTIAIAKQQGAACFILCDTAHYFNREGATTLTFAKGSDSVDFALVNRVQPGDIVITQDYGLAAMCLARNARVLNQDGMEYTSHNIDSLLMGRHYAKKARMAGHRLKGQPARSEAQNKAFEQALRLLLEQV